MDASPHASSAAANTDAPDEGLCVLETVEDVLHRHQASATENCTRLSCHIADSLPSRILIDSLLLRETLDDLTLCLLAQARNSEICLELYDDESADQHSGQRLAVEVLLQTDKTLSSRRLRLSDELFARINERLAIHGGELQAVNRSDYQGLSFTLPYETRLHRFADHQQPQARILYLETDREERAAVHRSLLEISPDICCLDNEQALLSEVSGLNTASLIVIGMPETQTCDCTNLITRLRQQQKTPSPILLLCSQDNQQQLPPMVMRLGKPIRKKGLMRVANRLIREGQATAKQNRRHVLIAEDNPINLKVISKLLSHHGIAYSVATDGQMALDLFQQQDVDLILMDIHMPGMDGIEATRQIRTLGTRGAEVPVIAMTADTLHETRTRCRSVGINDSLIKPLVLEDIQTSVMSWLYDTDEIDMEPPADTNPVQEMHGELQDMLLEMLPGYLLELNNAAANRDRTGLCDVAHALAGAASYCKANDLKRSALSLQDRLHDPDLPEYRLELEALTAAMQALMLNSNLPR